MKLGCFGVNIGQMSMAKQMSHPYVVTVKKAKQISHPCVVTVKKAKQISHLCLILFKNFFENFRNFFEIFPKLSEMSRFGEISCF